MVAAPISALTEMAAVTIFAMNLLVTFPRTPSVLKSSAKIFSISDGPCGSVISATILESMLALTLLR